MSPTPVPLPLRLYGALAEGLARPALRRADARLTAAGIAPERLAERRGQATLPRPEGRLTWIHAASVGESLSALPLVTRLIASGPVLVTTGTGTSARIMADRLPGWCPPPVRPRRRPRRRHPVPRPLAPGARHLRRERDLAQLPTRGPCPRNSPCPRQRPPVGKEHRNLGPSPGHGTARLRPLRSDSHAG